jgi:hypothetical protein
MSPTAAEIVRRNQQEQARREAEAQRQRDQEARREEQIKSDKLRMEQFQKQQAERLARERLEKIRRISNEVFRTYGAYNQVLDLKNNFLNNINHQDILINNDVGELNLVWGSRYKINPYGQIDYDKGIFGMGTGEKDYSCISIRINPDDNSVAVCGATKTIISEIQWRRNAENTLWPAIGEAFSAPQRVQDREYTGYTSSENTSNTECCNS